MKKQLLILLGLFLAFSLQARVAYLLPGNATYNGDGQFTNFDFPEAHDGVNQDPEWNAATWFYNNYVKNENDKGDFITIDDFASVCSNYQAIWIHRDLVNANALQDARYSVIKSALTEYVKAGGNLLLTKQASSLLDSIGRITTPIQFQCQDYEYWSGECKWTICTDFNGSNNSGHALYSGLKVPEGWPNNNTGKNVEVTFIGEKKHHTNHNCGIVKDNVGGKDGFRAYESTNSCHILGTWGGSELDFAGVIEFDPTTTYQGRILMIGIAAYQWTRNNVGDVTKALDTEGCGRGWGGENVLRMTKNALRYLNKPSRGDAHFDEDLLATGRDKYDNTKFMELYPSLRGFSATYQVIEGAEKTEVIADGGAQRLAFKQEGPIKLQVNLTVSKSDYYPDGTYSLTQDINFAFDKDEPVQGWPAELEGVKAGSKVTLYDITEDYGVTYTVAPEGAASYDNKTHQITFFQEGDVTITASVDVNAFDTRFPQGIHTYNKTVTVGTPTINWTRVPGDAAVLEYKDPATATTDVLGATIKFRSLNTDILEIGETSGELTYKKPSGEEGSDPYGVVTVEAYVQINEEREIKKSYDVKVYGPKADWVTRPATTAKVGEEVAIAANVRYGAATIGFDYNEEYCTYNSATGKIRFIKGGTTTIRPYAEAYGEKYYNNEGTGEEITITVTYKATEPTEIRKHLDDDFPPSGKWTDGGFTLLHPNVRDFEATYAIKEGDESNKAFIAEIGNQKRLVFGEPATVTLQIMVTETATYKDWPAGDYTFEQKITFSGEAWPVVNYAGQYTYTREAKHMTDGTVKYGTICLPYSAKVSMDECELYTVEKRVDENNVLKSIVLIGCSIDQNNYYNLGAGDAFLYLPKAEAMSFFATGDSKATPYDDECAVHGTFMTKELSAEDLDNDNRDIYVLNNNEVRQYVGKGKVTIKPFNGYLDVNHMDTYNPNAHTNAMIRIVPVQGAGLVTGVEEATAAKATKALVNGKLVIVRGARTYNINGAILK